MLFLLLACADDSTVLAALAPTLDPVAADALVGARTPTTWNMHTLVVEPGDVRLHDEGEVFVGASGFGYGPYPVIDTGTGVRVLASDTYVRTLLWLDREALQDVVAETAWVDAEGRPVHGLEAGIRVRSGSQVFEEDGGAWVRFSGYFVDADVRVSRSLIDQVSIDQNPAEAAADLAPLDHATEALQGGTTLYDDERRALLTLDGDDGVGIAMVPVLGHDPELGTLVLVGAGHGQLVRGWVDPDRLGANAFVGYGSSWGCGCCGWGRFRGGGDNYEQLPGGSVLYTAPGGEVIGLTETAVSLFRLAPPQDGWVNVDVSTPFGTGPLWVRHDDAEPTEADMDAENEVRYPTADIEIRALDAWN